MHRLIIIFSILLNFSLTTFSQGYVNTTKFKAKEMLSKYERRTKLHTIIKETDSTLTLLLRDSLVQNLDLLLHFDTKDKCDKEICVLSCDSCYQKLLKTTISNKFFHWVKIDDETYFARYPYRLILKTKIDKEFSYEIRRNDIVGYAYRRSIRKALAN